MSPSDTSQPSTSSTTVRSLHVGEDESGLLKKIPGTSGDEEEQFQTTTRRKLRKRK